MLAVYTLSSKKRNVLVDPNKYEYNLQSMSRGKTKSFWNCKEKRKQSKCVATAVLTTIIIILTMQSVQLPPLKKSILAMLLTSYDYEPCVETSIPCQKLIENSVRCDFV